MCAVTHVCVFFVVIDVCVGVCVGESRAHFDISIILLCLTKKRNMVLRWSAFKIRLVLVQISPDCELSTLDFSVKTTPFISIASAPRQAGVSDDLAVSWDLDTQNLGGCLVLMLRLASWLLASPVHSLTI